MKYKKSYDYKLNKKYMMQKTESICRMYTAKIISLFYMFIKHKIPIIKINLLQPYQQNQIMVLLIFINYYININISLNYYFMQKSNILKKNIKIPYQQQKNIQITTPRNPLALLLSNDNQTHTSPKIQKYKQNRYSINPSHNKQNYQTENHIERNSLYSTNNYKNINQRPCPNHPKKEGKYEIMSEQIIEQLQLYCQKCAILLASQGFKVIKLDDKNNEQQKRWKNISKQVGKNKRQQKLKNLMNKLKQMDQNIKERKYKIQNILVNSENKFNQQIQQVNIYFQNLFDQLQLIKNKYYMLILTQKRSSQNINLQLLSILTQTNQEISSIITDIQSNSKIASYKLKQNSFQSVIDFYHQRIHRFQNILSQWTIKQVMVRKLNLKPQNQIITQLQNLFVPQQKTTITTNLKEQIEWQNKKKIVNQNIVTETQIKKQQIFSDIDTNNQQNQFMNINSQLFNQNLNQKSQQQSQVLLLQQSQNNQNYYFI